MTSVLDKSIQTFITEINKGLDAPLDNDFMELMTKCLRETYGPILKNVATATPKAPRATKKVTDKKVPQKRGATAYAVFMRDWSQKHPNSGNIFKQVSESWGKMTDAEKKPFVDQAEALKEARKAEEPDTEAEPQAGAPAPAAEAKPKRPLNGYHLFMKEEKKRQPDKSMKDIGTAWKALGDDGQAQYKQQAAEQAH
jgi:hypothetical protein